VRRWPCAGIAKQPDWAEKAYPKLVHFNKVAKGGHFAAWEQPKIFTEELRAGFRSLRTQEADKAA
jgi:pimeloyl-ACP methyl ester carboxylesterase